MRAVSSVSLRLLAATALAAIAATQQPVDTGASKLDAVRDLFAKYDTARQQVDAEMKPLQEHARAAARGSDEQKEAIAKMGKLRQTLAAPQQAFEAAFAASAWQKLDAKSDAALLKAGLPTVAGKVADAPQAALDAARFYLEHFGDDRAAANVRSTMLPAALIATGNLTEAEQAIEARIADAKEPAAKARALWTRGDLAAAQGQIEVASHYYADAGKAAEGDEQTLGYVTLRQALIGKPAPAIASTEWIGAEKATLADKKGKIVLVDFWATWCGPCRAVMPSLNGMYQKHKDQGLEVLGVTRFYKNGYMPADASQMLTGGESVQEIKEDAFVAHVTRFRQNTGITYPFVISDEATIRDAYKVKGIPTLAVIGKDGAVALLVVGSGPLNEALLHTTVARLLAAK